MTDWRLFIWLVLLMIVAGGCEGRAPVSGRATSSNADAGWFPEEARRTPGAKADAETDIRHPPPIKRWVDVEDLGTTIAVFETVFWEPEDTTSLRRLILQTPLVEGKRVLEIGTGSGLVSLCCLDAGAAHVVATDVNRTAIANARFNANNMQLEDRLETRLVPLDDPSAYRVIDEDERFDLIISNPPWEDDSPQTIDEYALYDRNFALLRSLLENARDHLRPDGKILLAYGCVDAIRQVQQLGAEYDFDVRILDDRDLDSLEPVFLPGMLLELTPRAERIKR